MRMIILVPDVCTTPLPLHADGLFLGLFRSRWIPCERNWAIRQKIWRVRSTSSASDSSISKPHTKIAANTLSKCSVQNRLASAYPPIRPCAVVSPVAFLKRFSCRHPLRAAAPSRNRHHDQTRLGPRILRRSGLAQFPKFQLSGSVSTTKHR